MYAAYGLKDMGAVGPRGGTGGGAGALELAGGVAASFIDLMKAVLERGRFETFP